MRPPTHLDVGPHRYTITVDHAAICQRSVDTRRAINAETDADALTITLSPNVADSVLREHVLHETLHACCALVGLGDATGPLGEDDREERVVLTLAPALLDVLRSNPDLVAYLTA